MNAILDTHQWQQIVLEEGQVYTEIRDDGVTIAVPVFFSPGFVEGAIVFYSQSLSAIIRLYETNSHLLLLDSKRRVIFASDDSPFTPGQRIVEHEFDDWVHKTIVKSGLAYVSFESYRDAYSTVLYLLPFIFLTLFLTLFALYLSTNLIADRGSETLSQLANQLWSGFTGPTNDNTAHSIKELSDIRQAFNNLREQVDTLSLSNARVNNVINALYEYLIVLDANYAPLIVNQASRDFMHRANFSEHQLEQLVSDLQKFAKSGSNLERFEATYIDSETEDTLFVSWYTTPLTDEAGEQAGLVIVGEDQTRRKYLESQLRLKTQAVDRASTSILISDITQPGEPIIYTNSACEQLTGYKVEDFLGNNCRFLQGPDTDKRDTRRIRDAINKREPVDVTLVNYKKDGSPFYNHLTLTPIISDSGEVTHYLGIQQDVTAAKEAAEYLEQARVKAEESSRMKTDFLANMSHEIRTPINGIYGFLQLLNETGLNKKQRQFVEMASTSTQNLLHIINDILDLSKIEAGKLSIEKIYFDPLAFFEEIISTYQTHAQSKDLDFEAKIDIPDELLLNSDPTRIRQVIVNLLSNAIKFTEHGKVRLSAAIKSVDDVYILTVAVKDTGVGISPDKQAAIFEQFSQEDVSTTREFGGTGLGLSISQQLCQLLGGEIKVVSQKGQGSQFRATFAITTALRSEQPIQKVEQHTSVDLSEHRECKVLLVEDNHINQVVAQNQLDEHRVEIADNGLKAIEHLRDSTAHYDVILMDCQMPVMDGFEASERIRAGDAGNANRKIPIIALTANAMKGDRERCLAAGMNDYISKPFDATVLNQKVRFWAGKNEVVAE
ncbi:ATP-binding protein [Alteromonas sp. ASW11-36]|uniref:histidine kinase n=1 Tax=Alteromonas arenosi TaxID=3055817 RepID=A0ABT7T0P9_9ALTE|nr:ATP-binding protein [Alteromonas sp. ASW11-36]MDM7862015.1 ATP-binding protein [Alteromonas sp. ASW11-36]